MRFYTTYASPVGQLTLASDGTALTGLWIKGQKYHGDTAQMLRRELPVLDEAKAWLDSYFAGGRPSPTQLPLAPVGSPFRQAVWRILRAVPYGQVITYGTIARALARQMGTASMSSQAVGGAVGHNPISIVIPCHRVVGANGSLTGYAGGIANKVKLLALEAVDLSALYVPEKGTAL